MRLHYIFLSLVFFTFSVTEFSFSEEGKEKKVKKEKVHLYQEEERSSFRFLWTKKMPTPAQQWAMAMKFHKQKKLKKTQKQLEYLVFRWPHSKEAPLAQRVIADILYANGALKDAFDAYQYLIDNYSSRMKDYNSVLNNQFDIALKIMKKRRMTWMFGGYTTPERAVKLFEQIIRNGAQWEKAPEAQFLIGKAQEEDHEYELAIVAYSTLTFRYPSSEFAEEATWRKIKCLQALHKKYENSPEILDRYLVATTYYLLTYNKGKYNNDVRLLRNELYEIKAKSVFSKANFYAKKADPRQPKAAILYYKKMLDEYPKSKLVPLAKERIAQLEIKIKKREEKRKKKKEVKND